MNDSFSEEETIDQQPSMSSLHKISTPLRNSKSSKYTTCNYSASALLYDQHFASPHSGAFTDKSSNYSSNNTNYGSSNSGADETTLQQQIVFDIYGNEIPQSTANEIIALQEEDDDDKYEEQKWNKACLVQETCIVLDKENGQPIITPSKNRSNLKSFQNQQNSAHGSNNRSPLLDITPGAKKKQLQQTEAKIKYSTSIRFVNNKNYNTCPLTIIISSSSSSTHNYMYLNKVIFPAPQRTYEVKDLANNLIYIPRERHTKKKFNVKKQRSQSPPTTQKPKKSLLKAIFSKLGFKKKKSPKENGSDQKNSDITPAKTIDIYEDLDFCAAYNAYAEEDSHTKQLEDIPNIKTLPKKHSSVSPKRMNFAEREENFGLDDNVGGAQTEGKKKKKKYNCMRFSFKNKEKKFDLEMFDGVHEPEGGDIKDPKDLNHLNSGIINQIINSGANAQKKNDEINDMNDNSSSDSDGEEHEHMHHVVMNGNKIILKNVIFIPCLYLQSPRKTRKTLLYFHSNGEDLNQALELLLNINKNLMLNIVAIEYPGYGIYKGSPSERKVCMDAETVYNCLTHNVGINEQDIFIFGRSIGTGPAVWLASIKNPGMLGLMSGFSSIKHIAQYLVGKLGGYFIKQRFRSLKRMPLINCPTLLIHGKKDTLIPFKQSTELFDALKVNQKEMYLSETMTHTEYDYFSDVGKPMLDFLKKYNLLNEDSATQNIQCPDVSFLKTPNYEPLLEKYKHLNKEQLVKKGIVKN